MVNAIQTLIINKLKTDTLLVPSPFIDVINRWPQEGSDSVPGSTPQFWDDVWGRMSNGVAVLDGGSMDAAFASGWGGRASEPFVIGWVSATDSGKSSLGVLDKRILFHFGKKFYEVESGLYHEFRVVNRLSLEEGSELGYNGMLIVRWMIEVVGYEPLLLK